MTNTRTYAYLAGFCMFTGFLLMPTVVFGQEAYQELAPLPIPGGSQNASFSSYLGSIFTFTIGIAVALAVLMIALGGIRYMSTDAVSGKRDGLDMVNAAIGGLILIALSWLILRTINPGLLNFSLDVKPALQGKPTPSLVQSKTEFDRYIETIDNIYKDSETISTAAKEIEAEVEAIRTEITETDDKEEAAALALLQNQLVLEAQMLRKFESFRDIWLNTVNKISHNYASSAPKDQINAFYISFSEFERPALLRVRDEFLALLKEYKKIGETQFSYTDIQQFIAKKVFELNSYQFILHEYRLVCPADIKQISVDGSFVDITCLMNGRPVPEAPTMELIDTIEELINLKP